MKRLFLLLLPVLTWADDASWPGGVAILDLGAAEGTAPVAEFDGKRVLVMEDGGRWHAVVGVPLSAKAGSASITIGDGATLAFDVNEHQYLEEHLEVAQSYVSLSEENLARYQRERKVIDAALSYRCSTE